jgi:hypothetical protein
VLTQDLIKQASSDSNSESPQQQKMGQEQKPLKPHPLNEKYGLLNCQVVLLSSPLLSSLLLSSPLLSAPPLLRPSYRVLSCCPITVVCVCVCSRVFFTRSSCLSFSCIRCRSVLSMQPTQSLALSSERSQTRQCPQSALGRYINQ